MRVKVEDGTGSVHLYMREQAALALAQVDDKGAFQSGHAQDALNFPSKASVEIYRKASGSHIPEARGKGHATEEPYSYIIAAAEQALENAPSERPHRAVEHTGAYEARQEFLRPCSAAHGQRRSTLWPDSRSPAPRQSGKQSASALVLISATSASQMGHLNEGYQLIAENVKGQFNDAVVCTLVSVCSLTSAPDYQLKPKRGQQVHLAIATIVDVLDPGSAVKPPSFLATSIDKINDDTAAVLPDHMSRALLFAALAAEAQSRSDSAAWTDTCSPANVSKRRRLG